MTQTKAHPDMTGAASPFKSVTGIEDSRSPAESLSRSASSLHAELIAKIQNLSDDDLEKLHRKLEGLTALTIDESSRRDDLTISQFTCSPQ